MWAAVETVGSERLAVVLQVPRVKRGELRERSTSDEDYKQRLIEFYLQTCPASWGHLGGRLLYWGHQEALRLVKEHIVSEQGEMWTCDSL